MSNILKGLNEGRSYGRDSWDSNMPGYQGDYGGAENFGRRNREWDEDDRIDARLRAQHAQKQEYERNGKFWLKFKDSQRHLPAGPFIGKQAANTAAVELLKQQPELKGNLLITAYGPDETQGVAEGSEGKTPGIALSKAYKKDFDDKKPGQDRKETALTGTYSKTGKPGGELKKQGVAEAEIDRPGMKDGRPYSDPYRRHPGNSSYMTPEYLIQKYKERLEQIAAGPYKRPKEVAQLQSRIAKLEKQGVAEDQLDEAKIASSEDEDFFHKGKKVGSITKITLKDGMVYYRASAGNSHISGSDTRQEALKDLKELLRREKQQGVAEGLSKRDQKDVDAIKAAIERLQAQLSHPNADKAAIQQSIEHEKKRLALYGQGVAEAGNKPLEKSRFGTGDTRTPRDIKSQMQGASDEFVKSTADKKTGPFHSKVAKMQGKMAKSELRRREQGVAEGQLDELSNKTLASYKKKAGADASQADKRGDYARGDKRMSGIIKATKKEFDNDAKGIEEEKQRLDPSCWKGYKKQGTKMKGDTRVNNCVPVKKESAIMKGLVDEDSQGDK